MTRYSALLSIYQNLDTVYLGLVMLSAWSALTGHLLDWLTVKRWRILITIFWTLLIFAYVAGILLIGLYLS
jgi:hypothetical protein